MKISVAGTINDDTIIRPDGTRTQSLGGILYNVVALAVLLPQHTVLPVAYYGEDCGTRLGRLLSNLDNLDLSGMVRRQGRCNRNTLRYVSSERRIEFLEEHVPGIGLDMLETCLDSDIVLLNFTCGYDIVLETVKSFRSRFTGTIFMDVHSMTLGTDEDGARYEREVGNWREWAGLVDIIQMNLRESELFTGKKVSIGDTSRTICEAGPQTCLITLGSGGVVATYRATEGLEHVTVEAEKAEVSDTTGCGDVFSAGFIGGRVGGADVRGSCVAGNKAAVICSTCSGLLELKEALAGCRD